jgi:hypothetical protein
MGIYEQFAKRLHEERVKLAIEEEGLEPDDAICWADCPADERRVDEVVIRRAVESFRVAPKDESVVGVTMFFSLPVPADEAVPE